MLKSIASPKQLIEWRNLRNRSEEQEACQFQFRFRFANEQEGLIAFSKDFAEKAITNALRNLYGVIGMSKFHVKMIEALDFTVKIELQSEQQHKLMARQLIEFWTAMQFSNRVNNIEFRLYALEAQLQSSNL